MKFLEGIFDNKPIMPLNVIYDKGSYDFNANDDVLHFIYKDMDTGRKYVQEIVNPDIEVWICKKEYRNEYTHIKNFMEKTKCYPVVVKYKTRFKELAKLLGTTQENVKTSPYIFGADVKIEHFYLMNFLQEYPNNQTKKLSIGHLDIEVDIVSLNRFPESGEVPINAVTFIDEERLQCYTLLLKKDDVPNVPEGHPKYHIYKELKARFYEQIEEFEKNIGAFTEELNEMFYASYGEFNYNILMFDEEIDLIVTLFQIINASDNDYVGVWNLPFDMDNLISRPIVLGYDPDSIIPNPAFGPKRHVYFKEDTNANVHKRKHSCCTYTMPTFVDEMVNYAGIRAGKGKLPTTKLNAIAKIELKDSKLDYSEEGNLRFLPYTNYKKFVIYNIKDVMLQVGISRKTRDYDTFYASIYIDSVLSNEVFTSTTIIANSLRMFVSKWKCGYVMGYNKSKFIREIAEAFDRSKQYQDEYDDQDPDDDVEEDETEDDVVEEDTKKAKKKDKFQGAWVMNPLHMQSTGYELLGTYAKFIHKYVIDEDIGAEYPTAIIIMNSSNDTMVGKFFLENPDDIEVPIYDNFNFVGKEKEEYKLDKSNFVLEIYSQGDVLDSGHIIFKLPEPSEILDHIGDNLTQFMK